MPRTFVLYNDGTVDEIISTKEKVLIITPVEILPRGWFIKTYEGNNCIIIEKKDVENDCH